MFQNDLNSHRKSLHCTPIFFVSVSQQLLFFLATVAAAAVTVNVISAKHLYKHLYYGYIKRSHLGLGPQGTECYTVQIRDPAWARRLTVCK